MSEPSTIQRAAAGERRLRDVEPARGAQRLQRASHRRDDGVGRARGGRSARCAAWSSAAPGRRSAPAPTWRWMAKMAGYTQEENLRDARAAAAMFAAIDTLPVPVIAQIHGAALGGGAGLAAVADIAVAADDTTFGFTEVKLGIDTGGDCAVRAREDRSVRRARAVRDRPPLRRRARTRHRPRPRRRARRQI